MKKLSIVSTIGLFIVSLGSLMKVFLTYYQFVSPLISTEVLASIAKPHEIYALVFFLFFLLSLVLTIKSKYLENIIVAGSIFFLHLIVVNFIGIEWLR
jgi:hypothetical protein